MNKSHSKSSKLNKQKKAYLPTVETCIIIVLIVTAFVMVATKFHSEDSKSLMHLSVKDPVEDRYGQLLTRAQELTKKYKELSNLIPSGIDTMKESQNEDIDEKKNGSKVVDNVVLGMAQDTDPKNFAVFCKSLRQVSNADAVIFVNSPVPDRHKKIASDNRVTLVEFSASELPPSMKFFHPSTLRWVLFHNYMQADEEFQSRYKRVWMIDVRDSYFQEDPFAFVQAEEKTTGAELSVFHAFGGVESMTIKACGWNGGWVKDCFGESMLSDIGHNRIICSGVSVTSMHSAVKYIALMRNLIASEETGLTYQAKFPTCERNGVDQGVHNVLMHTNALPMTTKDEAIRTTVKVWSQRDSPVANMQARVATVRGDAGNLEVVNSGGRVAVVHQYDRFPELQKYLFAKYVDWVNTADFSSMWAQEPQCAKFEYREDRDLFRAKCDLKSVGGATSAASCCAHCSVTSSCQAFTFSGAVCFLKNCATPSGGNTVIKGAVSGFLK